MRASCEDIAAEAAKAERGADWNAAFTTYQKLFSVALEAADLETAAHALRGQSRACQQRGRLDEAEEFAKLSYAIADRNGHTQAAARALNTLAAIRFVQEDWSEAGSLYQEAMERAMDCGDDALVGWTCQNLGVLANLHGDLRAARAFYLESIASSARSGDTTTAVSAYNNLGMISADLEEWTESLLYFDRGLEIAEQRGDAEALATLLSNRAEPLIRVGEGERALRTLQAAETLASGIGNQGVLAEVHRFRGMLARIQNQEQEAEALLARAVDLATAAGLTVERAEATEEIARLRWQQGRVGAARATAREAMRAYAALNASRDVERVQRLLAEWDPAASPSL